jgi:hypothetical protein
MMEGICLVFAFFMATLCYSQPQRNASFVLTFQGNKTTNDRTLSNNSAGIGFGLQAFLNTKTVFRPTLEINGDLFAGTKELRMTTDGRIIEGKSEVVSLYAGPSFNLAERLLISATAGTSFYNKKTHFGIRPSVGLFLSKNRKWMAKAAYTAIFQRDDVSNERFAYASFGIAGKLF